MDRPDEVGTLVVDEARKPAEAAAEPILLTAPTAPKDEPAEVEATVSLAQESAPRPPGRHCIRCGHRLLDRAGFCTQCGTPAQAEAVAAPAPDAPQPEHASPSSIKVPRFEMPRVSPQHLLERLRLAIGTYLSQHEIGWEASMAGLAVAFVAFGFVGSRMSNAPIGWVDGTQALITGVFVAEYLLRVAVVADRPAFVRGHLVELLAISPVLRGLRVISLLWLVWLSPVVRRLRSRPARTHPPRAAGRRRWLLAAWALTLFTSAVAIYGYASSGGVAGREPQFVVLVLIISIFGGVTASLSTTYLVARDPRADQAPASAAPTATSAPSQHPAPPTGIAATGMNAATPSHHA
ncbi:MAG TPA: zinc ribbon domain-containing protein [Candidatus Limnocylindria bacterium]|nr:zinc ribbon domain-containing protein [Candidatus Limnocylindria bacterium]